LTSFLKGGVVERTSEEAARLVATVAKRRSASSTWSWAVASCQMNPLIILSQLSAARCIPRINESTSGVLIIEVLWP